MARNSNTTINVFGYPRSGNTYMHHALCFMYPDNIKLTARHTVWEVKEELNNSNIVVIVFRNPLDAITSWSLYRKEYISPIDEMNWDNMSIEDDIKFYLRFYNEMIAIKEKLIFFDFDKFTVNSEYIENKIKTKINLTAKFIPTPDEIKEDMRQGISILNLPRKETLSLINERKPKVEAHPLFSGTLSLYQTLQGLEKE